MSPKLCDRHCRLNDCFGRFTDFPSDVYWFPRYAELFVKGDIWYGDYMEYHRDKLEGLRKHAEPANILYLIYEKMKKDPRGELERLANFLGGKAAEKMKDEEVSALELSESIHCSQWRQCSRFFGNFMFRNDTGLNAQMINTILKRTSAEFMRASAEEESKKEAEKTDGTGKAKPEVQHFRKGIVCYLYLISNHVRTRRSWPSCASVFFQPGDNFRAGN